MGKKSTKYNNMSHKVPQGTEKQINPAFFVQKLMVCENGLEVGQYDCNYIFDLFTLIYGHSKDYALQISLSHLRENLKYCNYETQRVLQSFKMCDINEISREVSSNLVSAKYAGLDKQAKQKIMRLLLGYFLFFEVPIEENNDEDKELIFKVTILTLKYMFAQYTIKFAKQEGADIQELFANKLRGFVSGYVDIPEINANMLKHNKGIQNEDSLITFFNTFVLYFRLIISEQGYAPEDFVIEGLTDNLDNSEFSLLLLELGKKSLTETDIMLLAKEKLSEELFQYYSKLIVIMKSEYYNVASIFRDVIFEETLTKLLKAERLEYDKKEEENKSAFKVIQQDLRKSQKEHNKVKTELEYANDLLLKREAEIQSLKESFCIPSEYQDMQNKLEELQKENERLQQANQKSNYLVDWHKNKMQGLETRLTELEDVTIKLSEVQQENILILQEVAQIEDIDNRIAQGDNSYYSKLNEIQNKRILFLGGIGEMDMRLKEMFPNSDYIDIKEKSSNFIVSDAVQVIIIFTKLMTHAHTTRANSLAKGRPVILLSVVNTKLIVDTIYEQLNGHK